MNLISADHLSFGQLTEAYNQTRIDYIVPMPMNEARLKEYVAVYDVDLSKSWVAVRGDLVLGLGMLGIRGTRGWITRLGVLPSGRRQGIGRTLANRLIHSAWDAGVETMSLEVIKGNEPARQLFLSDGFEEERELLVARRPPDLAAPWQQEAPRESEADKVTTLDHAGALKLLSTRSGRPNWLNETQSMKNVRNLTGLRICLRDGGRGWVTYHANLMQITRIVLEVTTGNPKEVSASILRTLHQIHPALDAVVENLPASDLSWTGFQEAGYFDAFRRIEMNKRIR